MSEKNHPGDPFIRRNDLLVSIKKSSGEWEPDYENGRIFSTILDRYLVPVVNKRGYHLLPIWYGTGLESFIGVHRALWVMKNGIPLDRRLEVDHINNDPQDNRLCNLRLVTVSENHRNHPAEFFRAEEIRREWREGAPVSVLAERYGYSPRMIYYIITNVYYNPDLFPGDSRKQYLHLQWQPSGELSAGWNN